MAASCDILDVVPPMLQFPFDRHHLTSCSLQFSNRTIHTIAFKVKTTNVQKYCVRPNKGVLTPRASCIVTVTMKASPLPYLELQNMDKFLVQCMVVADFLSAEDITSEMFLKEKGKTIGEVKLKVYVMPPEQPSEISEGRVGSVSSAQVQLRHCLQQIMDNASSASDLLSGSVSLRSAYEMGTVTGTPVEPTILLRELAALVEKLVEEKNSALEQNRKLQGELIDHGSLRLTPTAKRQFEEAIENCLSYRRGSFVSSPREEELVRREVRR